MERYEEGSIWMTAWGRGWPVSSLMRPWRYSEHTCPFATLASARKRIKRIGFPTDICNTVANIRKENHRKRGGRTLIYDILKFILLNNIVQEVKCEDGVVVFGFLLFV